MAELTFPWEILPLFFLVALLYSSVGHGGASGYLALFALFGIAATAVVPIALILNILVASVSFWHYYRRGYFSWKLLFPFVLSSIPAAFLGGFIPIPEKIFSIVLGIALLLAAVRLLFLNEVKVGISLENPQAIWKWAIPIGSLLGLVSGMIGIGGGVFLSPLLLLLAWADAKRTAAVSSAFIVVNSVGGLGGHLMRGNIDLPSIVPFVVAVLVGGLIGSHIGSVRLQPRTLQAVLAVVLVVAGTKIIGHML